MHPRHAPGPGYPSGCRWPACGITCAAPAVRRVACHRACERRTPHSDTARSWRRKSVGYARHGLPRGQAEAGIRSGPALATGRAIGGRTAWYRWVGGLHPLNLYAARGLSSVQPSRPKGRRTAAGYGAPAAMLRRTALSRGAMGATPRGAVALATPPSPSHGAARRRRGGRCGAGCLRLRSDERASANRTEALY